MLSRSDNKLLSEIKDRGNRDDRWRFALLCMLLFAKLCERDIKTIKSQTRRLKRRIKQVERSASPNLLGALGATLGVHQGVPNNWLKWFHDHQGDVSTQSGREGALSVFSDRDGGNDRNEGT